MAREAELPDGTILEFPDGTPDEVIDRAVRSHLQAAAPAPARSETDPSLWAGGVVPSTDPTEGLSGGRLFGAGAGKSLRDTGLGLVQSYSRGGPVGNAVGATAEWLGMDTPSNPPGEWADRAINDNRQADAALLDDNSALAGNVTGVVGQFLAPGGALTAGARVPRFQAAAPQLSSLARLFMPTSVRGATAQGAAFGSVAPVAEGDSRALNTGVGALGGFVGGTLPRVLGSGVRGLSRLVEPLTPKGLENIAGRTIQRFARDPQITLRPDPITGRAPTLAEATLDPGIAQLQRTAQSKSPEVASAIFDARAAANTGRLSALQRFAGTPESRQAALDGVSKAENAAYAAIRPVNGVDVKPVVQQIDDILAGPQGKRTAVVSALTEARRALFMDADQAVPEKSVDRLIGARLSINDLISGKGDSRAGQLAQAQLIQVRDALDDAIRKVAPQLDQALDARRVGMRPVNEMDAMQELLSRATADVSNPVTGGLAPALRPAAFMRDGANLEQMARAGTGFRKAGEDVFSPQAQETIDGVRVGLARQQFADSAAKVPGSPTAQFLAGQNIMDAVLGQPRGGLASGLANLGATALDKPYAFVGVPERLNTVFARILSNPAEAQRVLANLPAPDRVLLEQAIGRITAPVGASGGQLVGGRGE
jgi:hypothetical protein